MQRFGRWVLAAGWLAAISTFAAEEADTVAVATNAVEAADLWAGMHGRA